MSWLTGRLLLRLAGEDAEASVFVKGKQRIAAVSRRVMAVRFALLAAFHIERGRSCEAIKPRKVGSRAVACAEPDVFARTALKMRVRL